MGAIILRNDGSRVPRNNIQNLERVVSLCRIHGFLVIGQAVSLARYIHSLLHKETGRKFTEILLEKRMERAALLLRNTTLSIEEISSLLGYSNHSNFFKAFKEYYKKTPREYLRE